MGDEVSSLGLAIRLIAIPANVSKNRVENTLDIRDHALGANNREEVNRGFGISLGNSRGGRDGRASFRHDIINQNNSAADIDASMRDEGGIVLLNARPLAR